MIFRGGQVRGDVADSGDMKIRQKFAIAGQLILILLSCAPLMLAATFWLIGTEPGDSSPGGLAPWQWAGLVLILILPFVVLPSLGVTWQRRHESACCGEYPGD